MGLGFEWSIRFGDILTFAGGLFVAATLIFGTGRSTGKLETAVTACLKEISEMKSELSEFGKALTKIAVQETKVDLLMKWYDELRRGIGKIDGD
jgi:hypothetical protein